MSLLLRSCSREKEHGNACHQHLQQPSFASLDYLLPSSSFPFPACSTASALLISVQMSTRDLWSQALACHSRTCGIYIRGRKSMRKEIQVATRWEIGWLTTNLSRVLIQLYTSTWAVAVSFYPWGLNARVRAIAWFIAHFRDFISKHI